MECPSYPSKLNHQPTFLSELTKVTVQLSSNPPSSDLYGGNSDGRTPSCPSKWHWEHEHPAVAIQPPRGRTGVSEEGVLPQKPSRRPLGTHRWSCLCEQAVAAITELCITCTVKRPGTHWHECVLERDVLAKSEIIASHLLTEPWNPA